MTVAVLYCSEGMGKLSLKEGILIGEFASCVSRAINNIKPANCSTAYCAKIYCSSTHEFTVQSIVKEFS